MKIEPITEIEYRVGVINSIAKLNKALRQQSKSATFALQYGATYRTLVNNSGFSESDAKSMVKNYNQTYNITKKWEENIIEQASKDGYVTCAFGLKLRTPLLNQTLLNVDVTPQAAIAEQRTAINAVQQSWGLLNTRAGIAFMDKVRKHPVMKYRIKPSSQIHDSQYFIIHNDAETLLWVNDNLVKEVNWKVDPKIFHEQIDLGGELSVFFPAWDKELVIPNGIDESSLEMLVSNYLNKLRD